MKRRWLGRDFHHKQLQNPFGRIEYYQMHVSGRKKLVKILLLITILGWIYFLFFSSLFKIENVIVNDLQKIDKKEILDLIWDKTAEDRFLLFRQKNINIFDQQNIIKKLNEKYFVEKLRVEKIYPKTINIFIKEKIPKALILNNEKDFYIDEAARLIEIYEHQDLSSSTTREAHLELHKNETLPIFLTQIKNTQKIRDEILPKEVFNNLFFIKNGVFKNTDFTIDYIAYDPGEFIKIIVKTGEGLEIYFDTADTEKQLEKLGAFLQAKNVDDKKKLQYIDLRFGDRIYLK